MGYRLSYLLYKPTKGANGHLGRESGTGRDALELQTTTVNPCVLSILIATLSQHRTDLNKKHLPDFEGGTLGI
jgi:hypothetical protein